MIPPPHYAVTEIRPISHAIRSRRWATIGVVCGLAVLAVTAMMRAGTRSVSVATDHQPAAVTISESENLATAVLHDNLSGSRGSNAAPRPQVPAPTLSGDGTAGGENQVHASLAAGAKAEHDLAFTALNFYHIRDGKPGVDYPWLQSVKVIEPFRETTLQVTNPRTGYKYRWSVRRGEGSDGAGKLELSTSGEEVEVILTNLDENVITLEEMDIDSGVMVRRLDENVMVKYVRREIRTLTDADRVELLNAVS